jgi:hypothetical protein
MIRNQMAQCLPTFIPSQLQQSYLIRLVVQKHTSISRAQLGEKRNHLMLLKTLEKKIKRGTYGKTRALVIANQILAQQLLVITMISSSKNLTRIVLDPIHSSV